MAGLGSVVGGVGDAVYAGGNGSNGVGSTGIGGAGGGGAGSAGAGGNASGNTAGTGTATGGGAGATGQASSGNCANNATVAGGGGCGGYAGTTTNRNGRAGARGQITITYFVDQTITFGAQGAQTYSPGGTFAISPTATATSGLTVTYSSLTTGVCTIVSTTVTIVTAGTCTIAADQAGNTTYGPAPQVTQNITINQASQTVTFAPSSPVTYGVSPITLTASASSGLTAFTFSTGSLASICTLSGTNNSTLTITGVGTCALTATQAGNTNYASASANASVVINQASQTVTFTSTAPGSATVGGATYTPAATGGASGNPVTITVDATASGVCSISAGVVSFIGVGSCVLDANQLGNANYNAAPQKQQSFAVGKGSQTITFTSTAPGSAIVGGATYTPTATGGASGNPVTITVDATASGVCSISAGVVSFIGVGSCVLDANQLGNANYNAAAQVQQSFTTTPLTVVSINCSVSCAATSAATVAWTVTFSTSVTGVSASAFALAASSGLSGAYIATVTGSGTIWTVTANTGIGSGTLGLNQTGPGSVVPTLSGTRTGQVYTVSATPALAEYRMDEARWNGGATYDVVDSSGGGLNAVAVNGASTTGGSNSEALTGNPGTCRYGAFNGGYVQTPLSNLTTDFTITAWIRTTDRTAIGQRILIDDENNSGGYGFSFNDAGAGVLRFYSRGIAPVILDSTYPIANDTWYFVAAVADITNKMRTIYVFNQSGAFLNSATEAAWTSGTWGTDSGPVSIGGETIASGEAALHFMGNLDEVRVYQKVLSQDALTAIAKQTHACAFTGPDHYELSLPTNSITCLPTTATVTACADASSPCINPLAASSGTTATLATNGGTLGVTPVTFGATGTVSTTLSYPAAADGTAVAVTLSGEQIAVVSPRQCCPDGASCVVASSCSTTFRTAGFIFSSSVGGGVATIPTQVAGTSSGTYYLRAVKTLDNSSHTCGAAFSGANTVNFAYECNNPTSCSSSNLMSVNGSSATTIARNNNGSVSSYLPVSMTFDATGNAGFTFVYSDVGQVKFWVNETVNSAVLTGSSNAFVVKPGGFVLSGIPAAADATGAKFVKAGEAFSAIVTATTTPASGALTTPNYGKEIAPEGVKLTNVLATGLGLTDNPALGGSFGSFTNGVATGTAFTWNEVGIIKLTPSILSANYLGVAGDTTGTQTGNVGRFYAAKFALSGGSIANRTDIAGCAVAGCGTFTYMGEQMSALFTLTAKAVDGTTTLLNYNWSATAANQFAKLNPMAAVTSGTGGPLGMGAVDSAATRTPFPPCLVTPAHPCLTPAPATAGTFVAGVATVTVPFTIYRDNAAAAGPYALLDIGVAPLDSDGATMAAYDRDTVNVTAGTANHTWVGQTKARYGRLMTQNIYGSEKLPLAIPLQAQYWNGSYFINNTDDGSTGLSVPGSGTAPPTGVPNLYFYPVTGKNQLGNSNTTASLGTASLVAGVDTLAFSAPGALHPGWLDIILQVPTYLRGQWGNCMGQTGTVGLYDDYPCARATFGVYGAKSPIIYRRENY